VKTSFWNFLAFIFAMAGVFLAGLFLYVFNNPHSSINPYPPPTPIPTAAIPTLTASPQALPELWTATPEIESVTETEKFPATPVDREETPVFQLTITPVIINNSQTENSIDKSTALQTEATNSKEPPALPAETGDQQPGSQKTAGSIVITAPVGVFNNTWQKLQSIPSFSWKVPDIFLDIKNYRVYFNTHPDGKPAAVITKTNYFHPAVPSGEYFLRIEAIGNNGEVLDSSQLFVFRYDDTPPTEPAGFGTTDPGTTIAPYFTWTPSRDDHSGMDEGLAGYAIYQGPIQKCGKPVAFTTVSHWTPVTPLISGTTEYFCVKALDAIGNESIWAGPVSFTYTP
jgi:hypothetical protein